MLFFAIVHCAVTCVEVGGVAASGGVQHHSILLSLVCKKLPFIGLQCLLLHLSLDTELLYAGVQC